MRNVQANPLVSSWSWLKPKGAGGEGGEVSVALTAYRTDAGNRVLGTQGLEGFLGEVVSEARAMRACRRQRSDAGGGHTAHAGLGGESWWGAGWG